MRRPAAWLGLAVSVGVTSWIAAACAQTDWYLLKSAGETIGQIRINRYQQQRGKLSANITEVSHINRMQREGTPFEISMVSRFEENPINGKPLKFSYQYQLNQKTWVDATGDIDQNDLTLQLLQQDQPSAEKTRIPLPSQEAFLFPDGPAIQKIYRQHARDPVGSRFHFQTMHLGLSPKLVDAQVTLLSLDELKLADGSARQVRKFEVQNPLNPAMPIYEWRDASGKLYKAQTIDNGMEMVYASKQEVRLSRPSTNAEVMAHGIPVNMFVVNPREVYQATYQIKPKKGQALTSLPAIPKSDRQQIKVLPGKGIQVTVLRKDSADAAVPLPVPPSIALEPYLQNSPYIQSTAAEMQRVARNTTTGERTAVSAAEKLRLWVYQNIVNKNYDTAFADARQTLVSRSGDCTEHAVLLAALTRAVGIPSRVAVGLLYMPDNGQSGRFVYHMWTEVWIGKFGKGEWMPLDATQAESWVDVGRIKFADSALNSEEDLINLTQPVAQWMGQIQIDVFQALTPGQSVLNVGNNRGSIVTLDIAAQNDEPLTAVDLRQVRKRQFLRIGPVEPTLLPDSPEALFTKGVDQLGQQQATAAMQSFSQAVQRTTNPLALYRLGERLLAVNMDSLASQSFERARQQAPQLSSLVSEWQSEMQKEGSVPPDGLGSLEALGDEHLDKEEFAPAKAAYQQTQNAMANHSKAWLGARPQQIAGKIKLATAAALLKQNQRDASAWVLAGQGLHANSEPEEAKKAFQNALRLQPDSQQAWIGLFALALETADWDFMVQNENALYRLKDSNAEAAQLLGIFQTKRRNYAEARQLLQEAHRLSPHDTTITLSLAELYERIPMYEANIGQNPQSTLWNQRADNLLRTGLETASNPFAVRLRLGQLLLEQGKANEAGQLAEQLLTENPLSAKAYLLAGTAKLYRNDLASAKTLLENARTLEPYDADILLALGHLASENGDEGQAVNLYRQASQLAPNNAAAVASLLRANTLGLKSAIREPLNADEQDYLAQTVWQHRQMLLNIRDAFQNWNQLLTTYGAPDFSIDSIQLFQETDALNDRAAERQDRIYQTLSAMRPPQHFAEYHARLLELAYASLKTYQENEISGFYTKKELDEIKKTQAANQAELSEKAQAFAGAQVDILMQLPKVSQNMLVAESRWGDQAPLLEEILALKKEIDAKREPKSTNRKATFQLSKP